MTCIGIKTALSLLSFLPVLAAAANSDLYQVRLKNGDLLSGELKSSSAKELVIHTAYAGDVTIKRSEVQAFSPLRQRKEQSSIATTVTATTTAPAKPWSLQLDLSAATRAGKEQAQNYSLTERFEYRRGDWRSKFDANYDYETKEAARKTHKYQLNPGLDYFYSPQLFWRVNADYNYNYLASDYKNIDVSTGPGYAVWQQGPTRLDLIVLVGHKLAYFREDETFRLLPDFHSPLGYNTASLAWDFSHKWPGTLLEVYSEGNLLELLSQPFSIFDFERELKIETGLRYALTDKIRISWSWHYDRTELTLLLPKMPRTSLDLFDSKQKISIGAAF
ncbi:DUF481 domain-containing protein [Rheinheimera tilapiae]|uniref:DUF481 domain-containing protein n=1 Tax=Rheinheimera tilapiae TaxID=875043 RepID=A0ABV6BEE8_9GAMM